MKSKLSRLLRSGLVQAVALVGLGIIILFWPVFFEGKVLVPGDIPFSDPFWRAEVPAEYVPPQNPLLGDQIMQFYIWHWLASKSMQEEGELPLWNPYIFTGQPLVANAQSALFYPPNLLLAWLTPGQVANLRNVLNLLIAGAFTFLFCRELGISSRGSILSALAFAFSGPVLVWLGHPHANALVWLPMIMWAGEKLLRQKAPLLWIGILSLGVGLSILGGHPETSFHVLVVFALYFGARLVLLDCSLLSRGKLLAALVIAVVLGMAISGIQLVPFADFLLQSSTLAQGGRSMGGSNWLYSKEWSYNLTSIITMVYPNFFGNPVSYNYQWPYASYQNYNEQSIYVGLIPLALAVGALFAVPRRRRVIVIAAAAFFCIGVAWRLPGFELINHLPVFSAVQNNRLRMPFVLLVAVLAGFGYDEFRRHVATKGQGRPRSLFAGGAILLVTVEILLLIAVLKYAGPLLLEIKPNTLLHHSLYRIFSFQQLKTMIPAIVAVAALVGYAVLPRHWSLRRGYGYLLIVLTMVELLVLGWGYNPVMKESEMFPLVQGVEILEGDGEPFRIMTTDEMFWPNYPAVYGISDVAGYDLPVFLRYAVLYVAQGGLVDYSQKWQPSWPLLDFLNTRYIVTSQELGPDRFVPVYSTEAYTIYENTYAMPRAFMVYDVDVIEDESTMLDHMLDAEWDPGKIVLLEEPLSSYGLDSLGSESRFSIDTVRYDNDIVVLDAFTEQPGLLVMSDLFSEDWRVQVDGERVKLHRANYTYRAVFVPEGRHEITFSYVPWAFPVGVGLTSLGLIVAGLLILVGRRMPNQRSGPARSVGGVGKGV